MKSTRTYLIAILCMMLAAWLPSKAQSLQVTISTTPTKANIQLTDSEGRTVGFGRTPVSIMVDPGKQYRYKIHQPYCHADSGIVEFPFHCTDTTFVLQPYTADIHWDVTPSDAEITIHDKRDKKNVVNTSGTADSHLNASQYIVTLHQKDYRRHIETFRFTSDTTLTFRHQLQYCPPRLTLALSGGLAPQGGFPLGLTAAYGGVHGFYGRFLKTWANTATGDEFTEDVLVDALYNPYSDVRSEYLSVVAGYQYYTPWRLYLQMGLGYGSLKHNWLSSDDDLRHVYSPDNLTGVVVDLGVGYPIGRCYVGAAVQSVLGSARSEHVTLPPVIALLNLGIIL